MSAETRHFPVGFSRGKKLVAWILKLMARILKSEPLIFSLLPCGVNALKISFHFSAPENAVLPPRFCVAACPLPCCLMCVLRCLMCFSARGKRAGRCAACCSSCDMWHGFPGSAVAGRQTYSPNIPLYTALRSVPALSSLPYSQYIAPNSPRCLMYSHLQAMERGVS